MPGGNHALSPSVLVRVIQIEERYWHLYWIPSYTSRGVVGLDATVDSDSGLDFKWINPTDRPVLIQSSTDAEHVTFRLYGQKPDWTVQVDDPVITDRVASDPTPEVQEEPSLPWGRTLLVESARACFSVLLTRRVTPSGDGQVRELALKSVYAPAHTVTLVGASGAPDGQSVAAAVEQLRASQQASAAQAAQAASAPPTHDTPNGPRTIAQIRDELRRAGWGGGSDQDALDTYQRLAAAPTHCSWHGIQNTQSHPAWSASDSAPIRLAVGVVDARPLVRVAVHVLGDRTQRVQLDLDEIVGGA